jgi:hypothetical protein
MAPGGIMFRRFLAWFEDYVADAGVIALVGAVTGILAFGGTLSAFFGNTGLRVAAFVAAMVAVLGMFVALVTSVRRLRDRAERSQRLLTQYGNILQSYVNSWRILDWDEHTVVDLRGDTRHLITVRAVVESDILRFFRIRLGCRWNQPTRYQKKVRLTVRSLEVDGLGGTRPDTVMSWLPDGRMEAIIHLRHAMSKGDQLNLSLEIDWPRKCAPLMRGEPDEFVMRFTHRIERAACTIVLPADRDVYVDLIGLKADEDRYELDRQVISNGHGEVRLTAHQIEPYRLFGIRLDQK